MTVPSVLLTLTTKNTHMDMTMSSLRPNRVDVFTSASAAGARLPSKWHFSHSDFDNNICLLNWGNASIAR